MRYYVIAGEASGDLHASNLMKELKESDPGAQFRCWGGNLMQQQGGELVKHYRDLAFMGFAEVVSHLPDILRNFRFCKSDLVAFKPDVLLLIDYPGFNLRMAKFASEQGIRVFYYISPQLWAWHSSRVKKVKACVDKMFVILPFEKEFYARFNYPVDFVGHPLLDVIYKGMELNSRASFLDRNHLEDQPIIALLPGSRKMEIGKMLTEMLSVKEAFPGYQFVIAGAPSIEADFYGKYTDKAGIQLVKGQTYDLLSHSSAALVTSGTATLETALFGIPQVVCYKGNALSYMVARRIVNVNYISLVNLIANKPVVTELIQDELSPENLERTLRQVLDDENIRQGILAGYEDVKQKLGGPGAAKRTAGLMVQYLREK